MTTGNIETTTNKPKKQIHIETWGCQMNVADSERMLALMAQKDYEQTHDAESADLIVLNTCHIREKATHKVVSRLGRLRELKQNKKDLQIVLSGCVAQAEGKKLAKQLPFIDVVIGPGTIDKLPELLEGRQQNNDNQILIGFPDAPRFAKNKENKYLNNAAPVSSEELAKVSLTDKNEVSRFVNIAQGCDNFCTFCVVPFTRGKEISLESELIEDNVRRQLANGAKEITLLGQNVNSYGLDVEQVDALQDEDSTPFVDLLTRIVELPGIERLRFTTSNPHDLTKPVADLFAKYPKLGKYIHLPVQSGSDAILQTMKRKVTVEQYWQRIHWLRSAVPDMAISTDLIVGFPGETDEDFQGTMDLVEKLRYSFVYAFKYSPRKGTAAARFKNQVPEEVKTQRLARLNVLQDQITLEINESEIGKKRDVLFLYESKKDPGVFYGRTEHFRLVRVNSKVDLTGQLLPVTITKANKTALVGEILN